jgi:DNA-binding PucR family transcriptional regulator
MTWDQIHDAAQTLLNAHESASKKPVADRSAIENHMATLGRNRLKSIVSLAAKKIEEQRRVDYRHEQEFFNQG